jgi:hypothetical protein
VAGTLLVCGATDFYGIGRTKEVRPEYPNLSVPHRLKALEVRSRSTHHRLPPQHLPPHLSTATASLQALVLFLKQRLSCNHLLLGRESGLYCCWRCRQPLHHRRCERRVLHLGPQRGTC